MSLIPSRAAALAALCIAGATAAPAAELHLYDGDNCSGEMRMTDRSIQNLHEIGFDNRPNSFRIWTGRWRFYRDAGYGTGNGPAMEAQPIQADPVPCISLSGASGGAFPADRMSAVELVEDTAGPQPAGVAILYDFTNFGGEYRILTRDVPDLRLVGFDNDTESLKILSGNWEFFRNANYGATQDRPSIALPPGDYADIAHLPPYPPNHFPGDLMSAARVAQMQTPPPPPACQPGQIAGDTACHTCWEVYGNPAYSSWPVAPGRQCMCATHHVHWNQAQSVLDGVTFRDCRPQ